MGHDPKLGKAAGPTGAPPIPADGEMRQYAPPPSPASSWLHGDTDSSPAFPPFHSSGGLQYPLTRANVALPPDITRAAGTEEKRATRGRRKEAVGGREKGGVETNRQQRRSGPIPRGGVWGPNKSSKAGPPFPRVKIGPRPNRGGGGSAPRSRKPGGQ